MVKLMQHTQFMCSNASLVSLADDGMRQCLLRHFGQLLTDQELWQHPYKVIDNSQKSLYKSASYEQLSVGTVV